MGLFSFRKPLIKKLTFLPFNEEIEAIQAPPQPSSKMMPNWYKELPRFSNNSDKPLKSHGRKDLKLCAPFRDAMLAGYMYVLPADMEVISYSNGDIDIFWNPGLPFRVVEKRGSVLEKTNQGFGMAIPAGCNPTMFAFSPTYGISISSKYMALVTHPFNRHDLPFVTTSGLLDTFDIGSLAGNVPFFIKEGFSGIISKGTPFAQVIPIKREDWQHKIAKSNTKEYLRNILLRESYLHSFYSTYVRQNKNFK